jgi:hypothetical protein
MNYRQLAMIILEQSKEVQEQTVTMYIPGIDEYYAAAISWTDEDCDVLDVNHMVITIQ